MINLERFNEILVKFKSDFIGEHWQNEKYKWEAVKRFQDIWDVNSPDFLDMFMQATDKTANLLANMSNFPRGMIKEFATADPEFTRAMFINLFDETKDLASRYEKFASDAEEIRIKYDNGTWRNHYQSTNAISTYLWLRYPDKYYIYKYSECRAVARELNADFVPRKGRSADNILGSIRLYDEICSLLKSDSELKEILESCVSDACYPDAEMKTLTIDFGFYISRYLATSDTTVVDDEVPTYFPSLEKYNPNLTKDDWKKYILEVELPDHPSPMQMLKAMMELGGEATCKKLSDVYGGTPQRYVGSTMNLGRRMKKYFGLPACMDGEYDRVFVIPFLGRYVNENGSRNYSYRIRPELLEALNEIDLSSVSPYFVEEESENDMECNYWWLNANPKIWSFASVNIGESQSYTLYNENGNKRRIYQNFLDVKAGDIVVCYESAPSKKIVGLAQITAENDGEKIVFEKTEALASPIGYSTLKECVELENMEFFINPNGSLFKLTKDEYDFIMDMIREENPIVKPSELEKYSKNDFLSEVYMTEEKYDTLAHLLNTKKNVILQGAPGVGKTFAAKRLAYSIMGEKDESRVEFVQFHQSYSYEDFIMGYKPEGETFELKYGIFYRFCQKAASQPNKDFFFIIDEINRGNISKILGELMMLIEKDYRGTKTTLAYNGLPFSVPKNLYLIGMMNTADRSLAMIDYALRRRFSFFEIEPGFRSDGFKAYQNTFENDTFNVLIDRIVELNKEIATDGSLGSGFCIGHSYFCGQKECTDEWMREVIEYDIIPMLNEYWFDDKSKVQRWENNLHGIFND